MIDPKYWKLGTVAVGVLLVAMIAMMVAQDASSSKPENTPNAKTTPSPSKDVSLSMGSFGGSKDSEKGVEASATNGPDAIDSSDLVLRVGRIGGTPGRDEITTLTSLPSTEREVTRLYRDSLKRACRMVVPGAAVQSPQAPVRTGRLGTIGRVAALTIGLEMDPLGREKLPTVVRGQVDRYLRDHRLSIQPVVYHDAQGRLYFGTDCQAAFYELERPGTTLKPEPMIETAVSRFRAVGIVGTAEADTQQSSMFFGRTLAMAFAFEQSSELSGGAVSGLAKGTRQAYELMLLHLPLENAPNQINLQVFVTKKDRTELHLLDTSRLALNSPLSTILAKVRFDKMILLGMYPAEPVVSDISFRSTAVLPMSVINQLTRDNDLREVLSITEILDQFGKLSGTAVAETSSDEDDWLQKSRQNKQARFDDIQEELRERAARLNQDTPSRP